MSLAAPTLTLGTTYPPVLSWTAVAGAQGYVVSRNGTAIAAFNRSILSFTDFSATAGTSYSYKVKALASGEPTSGSQCSSADSATLTNLDVGVRTAITLTPGQTEAGFVYGAEGKLIGDGATIDAGSSHLAGLYGQLSLASNAVVTSGHVAAIIADVQTPPATGGSNVDGIYTEQVKGTKINSAIKSAVNATYAFDLDTTGAGGGATAAPAAGTGSGSA